MPLEQYLEWLGILEMGFPQRSERIRRLTLMHTSDASYAVGSRAPAPCGYHCCQAARTPSPEKGAA